MVKPQCGLNSEKLVEMLNSLLDRELKWQPIKYQMPSSLCNNVINERINGKQRDAIARWLFQIHLKLDFNLETYNLCLSIFDRFLLLVRAHPKYLKCIAISCLFLAIKCLEEDEEIPLTGDMVLASDYACSVAEILRMERVILNKLQWNLQTLTALDFVHVLHALLVLDQFGETIDLDFMLPSLKRKLVICACNSEVLAIEPSTIAVALISLELSLYTCSWLSATILLQKRTKLHNAELIRGREVISRILSKSSFLLTGTSTVSLSKKKSASKPFKRKAQENDAEEDIYDGIKRLYGDDGALDSKANNATSLCASLLALEKPLIHLTFSTMSAT